MPMIPGGTDGRDPSALRAYMEALRNQMQQRFGGLPQMDPAARRARMLQLMQQYGFPPTRPPGSPWPTGFQPPARPAGQPWSVPFSRLLGGDGGGGGMSAPPQGASGPANPPVAPPPTGPTGPQPPGVGPPAPPTPEDPNQGGYYGKGMGPPRVIQPPAAGNSVGNSPPPVGGNPQLMAALLRLFEVYRKGQGGGGQMPPRVMG